MLHAHIGKETLIVVDQKGGITEYDRGNNSIYGLGQFGFTGAENWTSKAIEFVDGSLIDMCTFEKKYLVKPANKH